MFGYGLLSYDDQNTVIKVAVALGLMVVLAGALAGAWQDRGADPVDAILPTILIEEGFRAVPYLDSRGVLTVGYGTNLDEGISRDEGRYLARGRLTAKWTALQASAPWVLDEPAATQADLLDMSYQLGVEGLLKFRAMIAALEAGDCAGAKAGALDSLWARETPGRAAAVADRLCQ